MNFTDDLLVILSSYSRGYALMRKRMRGYTGPVLNRHFKDKSDNTIRVTLYRLEKKGLVARKKGGIWNITSKGLKYLSGKLNLLQHKNLLKEKPKDMIISFDIPEKYKEKRSMLRVRLKNLGFEMLHKSVWLGPAPLPRAFVRYLLDMKMIKYMKFFKAEESDIV